MRFRFFAACLLPSLTWALEPEPDPSDRAAPTPPLIHHSVLTAPVPAVPDRQSADWREANRVVGQFPRGHRDLLHWEAQQAVPSKAGVGGAPGASR